jgi:hypothetical protein
MAKREYMNWEVIFENVEYPDDPKKYVRLTAVDEKSALRDAKRMVKQNRPDEKFKVVSVSLR